MLGHVLLGADGPVSGHQQVEVHRLDTFHRFDPVRKVGVREIAVGQSLDGDEIHGEQGALRREVHDDHVVGVAVAQINELDPFAAKLDGQTVVEGDFGHRGGPALADDGAPGVLVRDDDGAFPEDLAAAGVVRMVVAVDEVANGLAETLGNLGF